MNWIRYGGAYLGALIVMTVVYMIVAEIIDGVGGVAVMVPVIAAYYTSERFVKDADRVPTPTERWHLLGLCFAIFVVVQIVQLGVVAAIWPDAAAELTGTVGGGTLAVLLVGAFVLEFALMWTVFRFAPKSTLSKLTRARQRKAARKASGSGD
ncbi:ABZJ_00895 family protein [Gordonia shandongensis]|uniref:ABZJ_00895 family protein n=1 Tax=Gordonia shandongensis TaxID=376351 RepID=UPI000429D263|nr:ABZJ_00895 family protein [Gordonia shandongensis]